MHILMIAPEPFFEPRGTPFSEYHRIRALLELGHTVDLVTYPMGRDVSMPGLRIFRCVRPPFVACVKIGPSYAKVPLDIALAVTALRRALGDRYDAVHSHEEGSAIGIMLAAMLGLPHLYDMHSSLPQQLSNFAFSRSRLLRGFFQTLERRVIRRSRVVVVICPHLQEIVRKIDPAARTVLIENAPGAGDGPIRGSGLSVRGELGLDPSTPIVLYTGTFEPYQGLNLLLAAARDVRSHVPDARFVLVGGRPDQIVKVRQQARDLTIDDRTILVGERPAEEIPAFLDAADVLVSPRSTGTNTPLKIYQYLRAGRPIVATRLLTHTQVLTDEVAILTDPTPEAFAAGIVCALRDARLARQLGERALALAESRYSYEAYLDRTREACAALADKSLGNCRKSQAMPKAQNPKPIAESPLLTNRSNHYSYVAYADLAMAERFDHVRFGGPIGALLLEDQERILREFLGELTGQQVIDVGTGTGRAALALARWGAQVTGVDASAEMLEAARKRAAQSGLAITFERDDAHALRFPAGSFDHAVSLRVLMHTPDWRRCVGELCRVARHQVVIDFPALASAAALQVVTRHVAQAFGRKVEAYRAFRLRTIVREFEYHGFRVRCVHRQFVLPIALHRLIGSRGFTVALERALAAGGLLRLVGSPVTIVAERRDPPRGSGAGVPRCESS